MGSVLKMEAAGPSKALVPHLPNNYVASHARRLIQSRHDWKLAFGEDEGMGEKLVLSDVKLLCQYSQGVSEEN